MPVRRIRQVTELDVDPAAAWQHATSLDGIRAELPWPLTLTTRPSVASIEQFLAAGEVLATLRLGPIPVLRWHPGVVELGGHRFVEASTDMTFMRSWRHERTIGSTRGGGCTLSDVVTFEPRLPGTSLLVRWLFARRHRALRRRAA